MNISDIFFSSSTILNYSAWKYCTNALKSMVHSFFTEIVYDKIYTVIISYNDQKINILEVFCVNSPSKSSSEREVIFYGKAR